MLNLMFFYRHITSVECAAQSADSEARSVDRADRSIARNIIIANEVTACTAVSAQLAISLTTRLAVCIDIFFGF